MHNSFPALPAEPPIFTANMSSTIKTFKFVVLVDKRLDGKSPERPTGNEEKYECLLHVQLDGDNVPHAVQWTDIDQVPEGQFEKELTRTVNGSQNIVKLEAVVDDEACPLTFTRYSSSNYRSFGRFF